MEVGSLYGRTSKMASFNVNIERGPIGDRYVNFLLFECINRGWVEKQRWVVGQWMTRFENVPGQ